MFAGIFRKKALRSAGASSGNALIGKTTRGEKRPDEAVSSDGAAMSAGGCRHEVSAFLSGDGGRNPAGRKIESERAATKTCRRSFGFFDGDVAGVSDSVLSGRFSPGRSRLHDSVLGPLSAACLVPDRGREWHESVGTTRGSMLPSHRAVIADSRRPHSRSGTEPPAGGVHREDGRLVRR